MCHWLGMLRPALMAHTDALGPGNAVGTKGSGVHEKRNCCIRAPLIDDNLQPWRCTSRLN
eukprot:scaffold100144_cov21-Phaeocystis_antarctica.AAC.1